MHKSPLYLVSIYIHFIILYHIGISLVFNSNFIKFKWPVKISLWPQIDNQYKNNYFVGILSYL
jgi:hypothetical protein